MLIFISLSLFFVETAFGLTLIDATGETLTIAEPPRRIVSLNPDFTENLFALGAGERVVGVTTFCDYPPEAARKPKVGDLWSPSLETIISLSPDLVLATKEGNRPQTIQALRRLGLRVYVAAPAFSLKECFRFLETLGEIVGSGEAARNLTREFRKETERVRKEAPSGRRPRVFFQLGADPIVSAGRATLIHDLIETAGGVNLAADSPVRYPAFSREKIIADDPQVIIIAVMGNEAERCRDFWKTFPGVSAVKDRRVHVINPDLVCRLSPRLLEGLKQIAAIIKDK